ncbi:TetR family transcriptional regulator [Streptomyces sp. NPDC058291]|jgi:AcrR family transcriptional regulator|uniref:TetR family transcriptional regulator n=1 Tax=Streptomyces sp. NPDC058291 TaxID=3346427 RepID=UPI0036E236CC
MPKQERSRRTYELVLDAAAAEFVRFGYSDASLGQVVERTGLTKGALYGHFSSKQDLAAALRRHLEAVVEELLGDIGQRQGQGLAELGEFICSVAERISADVRLQAALRLADEEFRAGGKPSVLLASVQEMSRKLLRETEAAGRLDVALPLDAFADLTVALLFGAYHASGELSGEELPQRVRNMWSVLAKLATKGAG